MKRLLLIVLFAHLAHIPVSFANAEYHNKNVGTELSDALIQRYQPTINTMTKKGWDHSNSIILHGLEKIYANHPKPQYLAYVKAFADSYIEQDGTIHHLENELDKVHPAINALFLYEQTGEQKYAIAAKNMLDFFLGTQAAPSTFNKTPTGGYWHKNNAKYHNVMTVDGLYMVHPFLVRYGLKFNRPDLLDIATGQIILTSERTFNIKANLPYQSWDYDKSKPWAHPITGTSSEYWSRASGWFSMALVDVLEYLPKDHPRYAQVLTLFQLWASGAAAVQHPDTGLWYQVMDSYEKENNYPEISGSSMIIYSLRKGVNLGLLNKRYLEVAQRGWQGVLPFITVFEDGGPQIHSVAPPMGAQVDYSAYVAKRPISVPSKTDGHHPHAVIGVLMAASVMENESATN